MFVLVAPDAGRTAPVYNIKAVVRLTGVPADTLRRWESRYNIIVPERTDSGYRLYSRRDVDTILWLKTKLEGGMSISRACDMLRQQGGDPAFEEPQASALAPATTHRPGEVESFEALCSTLVEKFTAVDEAAASSVLSDALSLYSVEDVCLQVLQPALFAIGEGWLKGDVSVAVEHFAASFVRARLENLFHSSANNPLGALVIVGCAPDELHEIGAMFLAVFLRRSGYRVVYLGQNVPVASLTGMVNALQPAAVCLSATRPETAASLYALHDYFEEMERKSGRAPLLGYGGQVFNQYPHITKRLGGLYLGEDARQAVRKISEQLQNRV